MDLNPVAFKSILQKGTYIKEIEADIAEAKSLGLKGVPFFVFNKKVAVFGGQEPEKFVEILQNALADWEEDQKARLGYTSKVPTPLNNLTYNRVRGIKVPLPKRMGLNPAIDLSP